MNTVNFKVSFEDTVYTADAVNASIVTAGATLDELVKNMKEAVSLYFEDGLVQSPYFSMIYSDAATHAKTI